MSFSHLPPQAYTRDVLAQAYEWLHQQPASIRELATNADTLVSLYMQSRRRVGQPIIPASNEPGDSIVGPASAEAFKKDLRALAEGIRQFEEPKMPGFLPAQNVNSGHAQPVHHPVVHQPANPPGVNPSMTPAVNPPMTPAHPSPQFNMDQKSAEMIRRVQSRLNLSSEQEALRVLIALGYDKVRDLLPKGSL